jgi:hypothetical protein
MSTSTSPSPSSELSLEQKRAIQFNKVTTNISLGLLVACPILAALPPRKLDIYTFALGGTWCASLSYISRQKTGRGIWGNISAQFPSRVDDLPTEKARELKRRFGDAKAQEDARRAREEGLKSLERLAVSEEGEEKAAKQGILEKVWMGGETEGWKERRLREEQEALDEGKGYGDLIMEQIWEVWNWRKKSAEDEEDKD